MAIKERESTNPIVDLIAIVCLTLALKQGWDPPAFEPFRPTGSGNVDQAPTSTSGGTSGSSDTS